MTRPTSVVWFLSRNASDRPTLSHAVAHPQDLRALCGVPVRDWSKLWLSAPLAIFSCKSCLRAANVAAPAVVSDPVPRQRHLRAAP